MSLRNAILGSLSTVPSSGYDLARQFDTGLDAYWSAAHSQIYPELKRLEDAGLVESSPTTVGEKLEKRVYTITDAGLDALETWAAAPPLYKPIRDPERLQFLFSDLGEVEPIRAHLHTHLLRYEEQRESLARSLEAIRTGKHERITQRLQGRPPAQQALTLMLRDLAYRGNIRRAEVEIEWAKEALAELGAYEREHGSSGGRPATRQKKPRHSATRS